MNTVNITRGFSKLFALIGKRVTIVTTDGIELSGILDEVVQSELKVSDGADDVAIDLPSGITIDGSAYIYQFTSLIKIGPA